jgi:hypothetical protein
MKKNCNAEGLDFFGNKIASEAASTNFCRKSRTINLGFYLYQIWFPCPSGAVFGMAYLITGHRMFPANITGPRHNILPYKARGLKSIGDNVYYNIYIESYYKCKAPIPLSCINILSLFLIFIRSLA